MAADTNKRKVVAFRALPTSNSSSANQSNSPLLRLPAEIRVLILRELLVSNNELGTKSSYEVPRVKSSAKSQRVRDSKGRFMKQPETVTVRGYHLTPAILRTCRTLYSEGMHILYTENTLVLSTGPDSECSQCGGRQCSRCSNLCIAIPAMNDRFLVRYTPSGDWPVTKELRHSVSRFSKVQLRCVYNDLHRLQQHMNLRDVALKLGPILREKIVVANTIGVYRENDKTVQFINQFRILRTAKFSFSNRQDLNLPLRLLDDIEVEIEGQAPIWNPEQIRDETFLNVYKLTRDLRYQSANARRQQVNFLSRQFLEAWLNMDPAKFESMRSLLAEELGT